MDKKPSAAADPDIDRRGYSKEEKDDYGRKRLLARMAGNIAVGVYPSMTGYTGHEGAKERDCAAISVRVAHYILEEIGL